MDETAIFIEKLITMLDLKPLQVEGGLFTQSYKSTEGIPVGVLPGRYPSAHRFGTAIYFLLTDAQDSFSALHRLLSDEIYHFYLGDPLEMLLLYPDGSSRRVILGQDILAGQQVQFVAPQGTWQGSHLLPGGRYALLGTTMAPGYEDDEFVLGNQRELCRKYPQEADLIHQLTRSVEE